LYFTSNKLQLNNANDDWGDIFDRQKRENGMIKFKWSKDNYTKCFKIR